MSSAADYRLIFQHAVDGIVVTDPAQRIREVNPAFAHMVGRTPESLVGTNPFELIIHHDLQLQPPRQKQFERDGTLFSLRRLRHADGSEVPVEIIASTLPDGSLLGIVRDIRRRPLTDALRAAESRLRAVSDSLNVAIVVTDAENRGLYVNDHMESLTGYSANELVGHDLAEFVAPRHRQIVAERMRARLDGSADKYEIEFHRKDGTTFTAAVSGSPMFDDRGTVIGTVSVIEDVTELRRREHDLAERERRYRSLFEVTPLPTWVFDVETLRFLAVNPAAVAHYGYSESEFLSMSLLDIRPPDAARAFALFGTADVGAPPYRVVHAKKDGARIQVDLVVGDFVLDGRPSRIVVAHDVTEDLRIRELQKSAQSQLLLAQKMEAVGGLAGGVAHDFNNLLSVVLGAAESIGRDLPPDSPLRDDVRDVRDAAERGAALTRQLLSLGRREVRTPELLDLNLVLGNVSRLLLRALGPRVRTELRRADGALPLVVDAVQLEQVILNLAINARDAMPEGGDLVITTSARELDANASALVGVPAGAYVVLEVRDSGIGMDDTTRVRAFEPFYTTKGPHVGTGLGLSTVYGIVTQSGGNVTIDSEPGRGTTMTLYLPRAEGMLVPQAPGRVTGEHAAVRGRRGRVLLVEDEPRVRAQARRLLERSGFAVTDAPDGAEGVFQFRARGGAVDVVVSDVMMPTMGGVEMVAQLREMSPGVPVVFVSGYTADDRDLPLDERTVFVPKPYTIATLCEAIDALIAS
ncbi:MAG: PAS domain S-box protein [Gemmatimonadaceae bacterium]